MRQSMVAKHKVKVLKFIACIYIYELTGIAAPLFINIIFAKLRKTGDKP